jgi:hypothetical protein
VETSKNLPFAPFFLTTLILIVIGWGGLAYLIIFTLPTLGPRWLFFFFTTLAASGLALPATYLLNRRFPSQPPADAGVIVRQAVWVGVFADLLVWLQLGNTLTLALVFFLAAGLVIIEFLLRLRERSRFEVPEEESDE